MVLVQVSLVDAMGTRFTKDGKIVGLDPDNDLAVLKVILRQYDVEVIYLYALSLLNCCYALRLKPRDVS